MRATEPYEGPRKVIRFCGGVAFIGLGLSVLLAIGNTLFTQDWTAVACWSATAFVCLCVMAHAEFMNATIDGVIATKKIAEKK